jgi:four helix bundle protein
VRDHRKLHVFGKADELVLSIYAATKLFPREEIYGLTSQIRRAAVSIAANLEGSARKSDREYANYVNISYGSAREVEYLSTLAVRLEYGEADQWDGIHRRADEVCRMLNGLLAGLEKLQ